MGWPMFKKASPFYLFVVWSVH